MSTVRLPPAALAPFDATEIEDDPATICALDGDLRITFVNRAWIEFGRANGGTWGDGRWTLGVSILDATTPAVRPFYEALFEKARLSGTPVEHSYECSSDTTVRPFRLRVLRCDSGALLLVHTLLRELSTAGSTNPTEDAFYRSAGGGVCQCSHCRRVQRSPPHGDQWEWVPEYVRGAPADASHGICPLCERYYFP